MAKPRKPRVAKRVRRSAEEARHAILDAAERQLVEVGPGGIRLQEIASEVGVSHPAVLHHFGSREELVQAVIWRALSGLQEALVDAITNVEPGELETAAIMERVAGVLDRGGYARIMAWMILAGHTEEDPLSSLSVLTDVVHKRRTAVWKEAGLGAPRREDTSFTVLMAALTTFADGFAGKEMRESAGLSQDANASRRFRQWFAKLVTDHLGPPPE